MKSKSRKLLSTLLAAVLIFSLLAAMPLTASAMYEVTTVTAANLATKINLFNIGSGGSGSITAKASGSAVTVTGNVTGATAMLTLNIASGDEVIWEAAYSGSNSDAMITLTGSGAFEAAAGGCVKNDGNGSGIRSTGDNAIITVSGGEVTSAKGSAIYCEGNYNTITVSGGKVETTSIDHIAVYVPDPASTVTVSGGYVAAVESIAILSGNVNVSGSGAVTSYGSTVTIYSVKTTVSGGKVRAWGTGDAIYADEGGSVTISGGEVSAGTGRAICAIGPVTVSGGFVFAHGTGITGTKNVIYMASGSPAISGSAVACAWNSSAGRNAYWQGSDTDLISNPVAAVSWSNEFMDEGSIPGYASGVKYKNGSNSGFCPISDVAVAGSAGDAKPFPFTDVQPGAWYYNDTKIAWETGLIDGTSATLFSPDSNLTYAQAVKLAACMHQLNATGSITLTNGSPNWYDSYVTYAKNNGIINKDYSWNTPATRAGYMEIFANALPASALPAINTISDGSIPDVPMTHPQAAAIYKLYRAGIVVGSDAAHNCNPGSGIKRSEVAVIITRMMYESARINFSL